MKIFLDNRTVEFVPARPENPMNSDLIVESAVPEELRIAWDDFCRYERFRKLLIIDPGFQEAEESEVFRTFMTFFKFVPAAGGLVKNENGAFLFIHRLGYWDLPKGKIEKSDIAGPGHTLHDPDTARKAAVREVKEETGLKSVVVIKSLPSTWHIYFAKEKYCLKKTQWFEMESHSGQALKPATSEGIFLVKWTPPENIHCILSHTYGSIRELLLEIVF
jgi:8-oxo-dGTP pyrophosphatase MutT (NUDIX family)